MYVIQITRFDPPWYRAVNDNSCSDTYTIDIHTFINAFIYTYVYVIW